MQCACLCWKFAWVRAELQRALIYQIAVFTRMRGCMLNPGDNSVEKSINLSHWRRKMYWLIIEMEYVFN